MEANAAIKDLRPIIEFLKNEAGLIGISTFFRNQEKMMLQCDGPVLREYILKNELTYNYSEKLSIGYEAEDYILFEFLD